MAKRPSQDAWLTARQRWQADPTETFESISKVVGVSRVAVSKHAEKEGWIRPTNLRQINELAQLQADSKVTPKSVKVSGETTKGTAQAAVDVRAGVLQGHRADWIEHRELFALKAISDEFNAGKSAKISAEMLLLRQRGERAAYGITEDEGAADAPRVMTDLEVASKMAYFVDLGRRRQMAIKAAQADATEAPSAKQGS